MGRPMRISSAAPRKSRDAQGEKLRTHRGATRACAVRQPSQDIDFWGVQTTWYHCLFLLSTLTESADGERGPRSSRLLSA
jgi:hypothetical protein